MLQESGRFSQLVVSLAITGCAISLMTACAPTSAPQGKPDQNQAAAPVTPPSSTPTPPIAMPSPRPAPFPTPPPQHGPVSLVCKNRLSGSWNFGTAPSACNVGPLQTTELVTAEYAPIFYDDANPLARATYMSVMYPLVRDIGTYYIKRRNPSVTEKELTAFLHGLFALAHQESFWSHYRKGVDGVMRYMRGDSDHGHGLMQVDDRSHAGALQQGRGVDLVGNMLTGLDIFYSEWISSARASCVSSPGDFEARTRSAWAAYNGGHGSICRWRNGGKYSGNDTQFYGKYTAQSWLQFVANPLAIAKVDAVCMAEGMRPCGGKLP